MVPGSSPQGTIVDFNVCSGSALNEIKLQMLEMLDHQIDLLLYYEKLLLLLFVWKPQDQDCLVLFI